ncbi:MAG: glycosyltransferase family 2 protein [Pseudomonadaceae bacterium]|nr:glycosyltransferase family 2 protein [Pseudomonadaceae bacterium]
MTVTSENGSNIEYRAVTIVIVSYQSFATILSTLSSVFRCYSEGLADCVVVDNSSTDGTQALIRKHAPWAQFIEANENLGFARGCNLGAQRVETPYTLFLNPDAEIEPVALQAMLEFIEASENIGIVGPATICKPNGCTEVLQMTGPIPTPRSVLPPKVAKAFGEDLVKPIYPGDSPFQTGWVCGAVFLIRTDLLQRLQGFDPRFFLYWEETDVCLRAAEAGFEVWAMGSAVAYHVAGASSKEDMNKINGCIARHYYQSRRLFMLKHYGWGSTTSAEIAEWFWLLGLSLLDFIRGRGLSRFRIRLQAPLFSLPGDG